MEIERDISRIPAVSLNQELKPGAGFQENHCIYELFYHIWILAYHDVINGRARRR
jgi:hypothetical protein